MIVWLILIIVLCIGFDFINGFHDAANSIATVVSTRVLTPVQAVIWSAFFNFVAFFIAKYIIGEFGVADTVSKTVRVDVLTEACIDFLPVVFSGLFAAITKTNQLTINALKPTHSLWTESKAYQGSYAPI